MNGPPVYDGVDPVIIHSADDLTGAEIVTVQGLPLRFTVRNGNLRLDVPGGHAWADGLQLAIGFSWDEFQQHRVTIGIIRYPQDERNGG